MFLRLFFFLFNEKPSRVSSLPQMELLKVTLFIFLLTTALARPVSKHLQSKPVSLLLVFP